MFNDDNDNMVNEEISKTDARDKKRGKVVKKLRKKKQDLRAKGDLIMTTGDHRDVVYDTVGLDDDDVTNRRYRRHAQNKKIKHGITRTGWCLLDDDGQFTGAVYHSDGEKWWKEVGHPIMDDDDEYGYNEVLGFSFRDSQPQLAQDVKAFVPNQ